uniref:Putative secreted protein n=1 Tax=Ixodes ricinus TaxID=34613 RepID=A0A6B0UL97_IXORI
MALLVCRCLALQTQQCLSGTPRLKPKRPRRMHKPPDSKEKQLPSRGVIPMGETQEDALQGAPSAKRPTRSLVRKTKPHKMTGKVISYTPPDKTTVTRPIEKPAVFPRTLTRSLPF